jgi:tetratricopeptide (TPR) repeat protein
LSLLKLGQHANAAAQYQRGLDSPSTLMHLETPRYLAGLALVALARGELEQALEKITEARAYAFERGIKHLYPFIEWIQGSVQQANAMHEAALDSHTRGEQLALKMGMRPMVMKNRLGAAAALESLGRAAEAAQQRTAALEMFDEIARLFADPDMRAKFEAGRAALE